MYLSDRDLAWAIECGKLVCDPKPEKVDVTSFDLHLDKISEAKIWNIDAYAASQRERGQAERELRIAKYELKPFGGKFLMEPPVWREGSDELVMRRGDQIILRRHGFLLWQTQETVGTNADRNADLICFVDGKSTRARTGIVVHLTAPTIHCTWNGQVVLEIVNLGPFDIVLEPGDVIAQITVAKVTSPPEKDVRLASSTFGQTNVQGGS